MSRQQSGTHTWHNLILNPLQSLQPWGFWENEVISRFRHWVDVSFKLIFRRRNCRNPHSSFDCCCLVGRQRFPLGSVTRWRNARSHRKKETVADRLKLNRRSIFTSRVAVVICYYFEQVTCFLLQLRPLNLHISTMFIYRSIAKETLYQKSFESVSIGRSVRTQIVPKRRRQPDTYLAAIWRPPSNFWNVWRCSFCTRKIHNCSASAGSSNRPLKQELTAIDWGTLHSGIGENGRQRANSIELDRLMVTST